MIDGLFRIVCENFSYSKLAYLATLLQLLLHVRCNAKIRLHNARGLLIVGRLGTFSRTNKQGVLSGLILLLILFKNSLMYITFLRVLKSSLNSPYTWLINFWRIFSADLFRK